MLLKKKQGFIDTALIITSLLLLGLASALSLVSKRQELREKAGGSAPSCPNNYVEVRVYSECCGCKKAREVRECVKESSPKYYTRSDCIHDAPTCTHACPPPTVTPQPLPPTPVPNCSIGSCCGCQKRYAANCTCTESASYCTATCPTVTPVPVFDSVNCKRGQAAQNCTDFGNPAVDGNAAWCSCCLHCRTDPTTCPANCQPTATPLPTSSCYQTENACKIACGTSYCTYSNGCYTCPSLPPTNTPIPSACTQGATRCSDHYLETCVYDHNQNIYKWSPMYCSNGCETTATGSRCKPAPTTTPVPPTNTPMPTIVPQSTQTSASSCSGTCYYGTSACSLIGRSPGSGSCSGTAICCDGPLPTSTPVPPTNTPTPRCSIGNCCRCNYRYASDCTCTDHASYCTAGCPSMTPISPTNTPTLKPTITPLPTQPPTTTCTSSGTFRNPNNTCYVCYYQGAAPQTINCSPTATPIPPTPTPELFTLQNECNLACWTPCIRSGSQWLCPIIPPTKTPTPIPPTSTPIPIIPTVTVSPIGQPTTTPLPANLACYTKDLLRCENGMIQKCNASGLKVSGLFEKGTWINIQGCENGCKRDGSPNCEPLNCKEGEIRCLDPYYAGTCKVSHWERKYCQFGCYSGACNVAVTTSTTPYGGIQATQPAGGLTSTIYQQSGNIPIGTQADEETFYRLTGGLFVGSFAAPYALAGAGGSALVAAARGATYLMGTGLAGQIGAGLYRTTTGQSPAIINAIDDVSRTSGNLGVAAASLVSGVYYGGQILDRIIQSQAVQNAADRLIGSTQYTGMYNPEDAVLVNQMLARDKELFDLYGPLENIHFPAGGSDIVASLKEMSFAQAQHLFGVNEEEYALIKSAPGRTYVPVLTSPERNLEMFTMEKTTGWGSSSVGQKAIGKAWNCLQEAFINPEYAFSKSGTPEFVETVAHETFGHLSPGHVPDLPEYQSNNPLARVLEELRSVGNAQAALFRFIPEERLLSDPGYQKVFEGQSEQTYNLWQRLMVEFSQ